MTQLEFLIKACPPIRLVNWLDASIAAKQKQGEAVPPEITAWLDYWRVVRLETESELIRDLEQVGELEF